MILDSTKIYDEGVGISLDNKEQIRRIIKAINEISLSSEISMRFLKAGSFYEGLLWGKVNNIPIGAYKRGPTMTSVLEGLYRMAKKEGFKVWRLNKSQLRSVRKNKDNNKSVSAVAG